jgi:hypothetical protein
MSILCKIKNLIELWKSLIYDNNDERKAYRSYQCKKQ